MGSTKDSIKLSESKVQMVVGRSQSWKIGICFWITEGGEFFPKFTDPFNLRFFPSMKEKEAGTNE